MFSFPFDSQMIGTDAAGLPIYDRASNSEELARWFQSFFTNGVFGNGGFAVTVNGLNVNVSGGDCLINGRYGFEKSTRNLTISGGGSQPRIDSVVLRLDLSLDVRSIDLYIKTGTPNATPVEPSLERNDVVWEIGIANIYVAANAVNVNQSAVTDTRLDNARCGIVAQAMSTIDTTTFYKQIQADLENFRATEEAAFDAWFESVKTTLDGDVAGNLLNLINAKAGLETTSTVLLQNGWSAKQQTVRVSNVLRTTPKIDVAPTADAWLEYCECMIRCVAQGDKTLTFVCEEVPKHDLEVNIAIFN